VAYGLERLVDNILEQDQRIYPIVGEQSADKGIKIGVFLDPHCARINFLAGFYPRHKL